MVVELRVLTGAMFDSLQEQLSVVQPSLDDIFSARAALSTLQQDAVKTSATESLDCVCH